MDYTELTTKDLIAHQRGIIRELEGKYHGLEQQAAMNRRLMSYYKALGSKGKGGQENTRQQIANDERTMLELSVGMPALHEHLAELIAQDTEAEPEAEAESVDEADEAPSAEPTKIEARRRRETPSEAVKELMPV